MRKLLLISVFIELTALVGFMSFAASQVDTALAQTPEETTAEETTAGEETASEEITTGETTATEETIGEQTTGEETVGEETTEETTVTEDTAGQGNKVERTRRERRERTRGGTTEAPDYDGQTPTNNGGDDTPRGEGGAQGGFIGSVNDAFGNISRGRLPDTGGGWAVLLLAGAVLIGGGWLLARRFSPSR